MSVPGSFASYQSYQAFPYYQPYRGGVSSPMPYPPYSASAYSSSAYTSPVRAVNPAQPVNPTPSRVNYPAHQLSQLKQQMGNRIINTSREPVSLEQLTGKNDGDSVSANPFASQSYTGVPIVDGAMQQAGDALGHVSHGVGNFVSTSVRGAAVGGAGALTVTGGVMAALKLLGPMKETSWLALMGGSAVAGVVGSVLGGLCGVVKAGYNSIRDAKDALMGGF